MSRVQRKQCEDGALLWATQVQSAPSTSADTGPSSRTLTFGFLHCRVLAGSRRGKPKPVPGAVAAASPVRRQHTAPLAPSAQRNNPHCPRLRAPKPRRPTHRQGWSALPADRVREGGCHVQPLPSRTDDVRRAPHASRTTSPRYGSRSLDRASWAGAQISDADTRPAALYRTRGHQGGPDSGEHSDSAHAERQGALAASVMSRVQTPSASTGTPGDRKCADPDCDLDCGKRHLDTKRAFTEAEARHLFSVVETPTTPTSRPAAVPVRHRRPYPRSPGGSLVERRRPHRWNRSGTRHQDPSSRPDPEPVRRAGGLPRAARTGLGNVWPRIRDNALREQARTASRGRQCAQGGPRRTR